MPGFTSGRRERDGAAQPKNLTPIHAIFRHSVGPATVSSIRPPPKLPTAAWINPPDEHTRLQNN
jgi:hypothetical protein